MSYFTAIDNFIRELFIRSNVKIEECKNLLGDDLTVCIRILFSLYTIGIISIDLEDNSIYLNKEFRKIIEDSCL